MDINISMIILVAVSLVLSALFSGVEMAYVSADDVRLRLDSSRGGPVNKIINRFYASRELFITTVLVGNNIVLVVYGIAAAAILTPWLRTLTTNEFVILVCQTLISTGLILITGEFFPKTIFRINPNTSLRIVALPVYLFYLLLYPISWFTSWLSRWLMRLCGIEGEPRVSAFLTMGDLNRFIERRIDVVANPQAATEVEHEVKIFHNALDFSETHLRDCMLPRNEIVAVNIDTTTRDDLSKLFTQSGRSKIVVYRDEIDNVLGYIHVSELFDPKRDWKANIKPVIYAPETLLANKLMRRLLGEKRSMAIVVDEFGGTAGLVTLEDLVEEIFGDIEDEHDSRRTLARRLADGVYEFSGRIEIENLRDQYHLDIPESDEYQTLAGYLLTSTGTLPPAGESITLGSYTFTVTSRTATRLEIIRVAPAQKSVKESDSDTL